MTTTAVPLTPRQQEVLDFVREYRDRQGYCVSISDICERFGFKSKTGAVCHLTALRRKGLVTWVDNQARTIRVTEDTP